MTCSIINKSALQVTLFWQGFTLLANERSVMDRISPVTFSTLIITQCMALIIFQSTLGIRMRLCVVCPSSPRGDQALLFLSPLCSLSGCFSSAPAGWCRNLFHSPTLLELTHSSIRKGECACFFVFFSAYERAASLGRGDYHSTALLTRLAGSGAGEKRTKCPLHHAPSFPRSIIGFIDYRTEKIIF